jgi:putative membrane protein
MRKRRASFEQESSMFSTFLRRVVPTSAAAAALLVPLFACERTERATTDTTLTGNSAAAAVPSIDTPAPKNESADGQVAHVLIAAGTLDSAAGANAMVRASKAEVRAFAERMVNEHGAMNRRVRELAARLNVTPEPSAISASLEKFVPVDSAQADPAAYDKAYIQRAVDMHRQLLETIDTSLLPRAASSELRNLVQEARTSVTDHLRRAEELMRSIAM